MVAIMDGHGSINVTRIFWISLLLALTVMSCKEREPEESFTKGSAQIGCSDAVFELARFVATEYSDLHAAAHVGVWRHSTQSLLDSLLNDRIEEAFLDRALSQEESLAFSKFGKKLYSYPVAHYPVYLLVRESLAVEHLDSVNLRRILQGEVDSWKEIGGAGIPLTVYAPLPGDGAWTSLQTYFGEFDSLAAVVCSTHSRMISLAEHDPGALLIYMKKPADIVGYKKLRWAQDELRIPANAKTILESPRWPFMTTFTYVTTHMKSDVAAGYLTFLVSNDGQKMVMNEGYRPASVPVRIIQLKSSEQIDTSTVDTFSRRNG